MLPQPQAKVILQSSVTVNVEANCFEVERCEVGSTGHPQLNPQRLSEGLTRVDAHVINGYRKEFNFLGGAESTRNSIHRDRPNLGAALDDEAFTNDVRKRRELNDAG